MVQFLRRKGVSLSLREYFITALSFMALGLFASLIIGLIAETLGEQVFMHFSPTIANALMEIGRFAMDTKIYGGAIGVAIAYGLKAPPLVLFSALFAGAFGAEMGGPVGSYVSVLLAVEVGKVIYQTTRVDIIITPLTTIIVGFVTGSLIGAPMQIFMESFGQMIQWAVLQQPFIMGMIVAVLMGFALTAPISSAAIAIMLSLDGLAAGAATIGCAAQMIGFATISYRDNGLGGALAQGIGTSMLQVPNIIKKPIILLPPTIAGALLAPIGTVWFQMTSNPAGAGMGTSGFVGQIMTFESMGMSVDLLWKVILLHLVGPMIISYVLIVWFRKRGWVKDGDMKIEYE